MKCDVYTVGLPETIPFYHMNNSFYFTGPTVNNFGRSFPQQGPGKQVTTN